ncbi:MAG: alpha-L-fucosidase, partial [Gemmatimonadetes bacterium]|nr:alpha-L-fucosidase [Gemmatimonadota bacterium]
VHVLDWTDRQLALPALPGRVRSARVLVGGATVRFVDTPDGVTLTLPPRAPDEIDQVIALVLERGTR